MTKKTQITLQHIADKLKVSKVTVSKALRDHPDISEERSELIKKTAHKMGYYPNIAARNLSSKKTNTIGVIVPIISNFFMAHVIEAIYDAAFNSGYEIILAVSQESSERERKHLETLLSMRVDGILISVSEHTQNMNLFEDIKRRGIPMVFFDRTVNESEFSSVTSNNVEGAFKIVEHAIRKGYKKIGHIAGWDDTNIGRDRYAGFKKAMNKYKIPINRQFIVKGGFGRKDGYAGFSKLLEKNALPELIFAVTYPVALGIYDAIEESGLKIPGDIDLMCFGNSDINEYLKPSISCVDLNPGTLGEQAFNLLLSSIDSRNKSVKSVKIDTELILN